MVSNLLLLQNLAAQDNEPMPDANDVYSDSDGKLNTIISKKNCSANCNIFLFSLHANVSPVPDYHTYSAICTGNCMVILYNRGTT